jgi:hypothetical protein
MIVRLDYSEEEGDVRGTLDKALDVASWPSPMRPAEPVDRVVKIDGEEFRAPTWWRGDEDASQSFLASMGVQLDE